MPRSATLLGVLVTFVLVGCGGEGQKQVDAETTAGATSTVNRDADVLRAEKSLLTDADLGEGWESEDVADDTITPAEFNCFPLDETGLSAHARETSTRAEHRCSSSPARSIREEAML